MDLLAMSVTELRAVAKDKGIKGYSSMKKQELIDALKDPDRVDPALQNKPIEGATAKAKTAEAKAADNKPVEKMPVEESKPAERRPVEESRPDDNRNRVIERRPMDNRDRDGYRRMSVPQDQRGGYMQQGQRGSNTQNQRSYQANDQRGGYSQNQRSYQSADQRSVPAPEQRSATVPASDGRIYAGTRITAEEREALDPELSPDIEHLDSGETKSGILEVMPEGYGFIRCENFLPGEQDVYVAPGQLKRFGLKTGDIVTGNTKIRSASEKFSALLYIKTINGYHPSEALRRPKFEDMTPIFPNERLRLETPGCEPSMRIVDLLSPIGKGQRGMIVSQPKAGKTTLLKQIARALTTNYPNLHIIILLIDERPEEVTDIKESIRGSRVEVIHSTFDLPPENHKRVSEMVIERARRLVEHKEDVVILLDSITRLARAYNLTCTPSGRTLSGGLDPAALHMPKKFFGAARNMREGGSLTILATALVDTGSRMDDVVFEEFKGTGNMELVLDRNLSERRIFPAIDLPKSGTRRDDLLLSDEEIEASLSIRRAFNSARSEEAVERIINLFSRTKTNREFIEIVRKTKLS